MELFFPVSKHSYPVYLMTDDNITWELVTKLLPAVCGLTIFPGLKCYLKFFFHIIMAVFGNNVYLLQTDFGESTSPKGFPRRQNSANPLMQ